jgi:hypothetical protein
MKISHTISLTPEEISSLFSLPVICLTTAYPSIEEQNAALQRTNIEFAIILESLISRSFSLGEAIGLANADEKDLAMYS